MSSSIDEKIKLKAKKAKANLVSVKSKVNSNAKATRPATERKGKTPNGLKIANGK